MVLSNAERQARFHERRKAKLAECVTPEDVRKAVRIQYELAAQFPENHLPPYADWLDEQRSKKRGRDWGNFVPDDPDPENYDGSPEERELLAKVGAVFHAARFPPE